MLSIEKSDAIQTSTTRLIDEHARCVGRIAELEAALDDFLMHCIPGPTDAWMMIPRTEFENIMRRGCLTPKRKQET